MKGDKMVIWFFAKLLWTFFDGNHSFHILLDMHKSSRKRDEDSVHGSIKFYFISHRANVIRSTHHQYVSKSRSSFL